MTRLVLSLAVIACSACASIAQPNGEPNHDGIASALQPRIEFIGFEYRTEFVERSYAVFELINETQSDFVYSAVQFPCIGTFDFGQNEDVSPFVCGSAIDEETIRSGERIDLQCGIDFIKGPVQVSITLTDPSGKSFEVAGPVTDIADGKANSPFRQWD